MKTEGLSGGKTLLASSSSHLGEKHNILDMNKETMLLQKYPVIKERNYSNRIADFLWQIVISLIQKATPCRSCNLTACILMQVIHNIAS